MVARHDASNGAKGSTGRRARARKHVDKNFKATTPVLDGRIAEGAVVRVLAEDDDGVIVMYAEEGMSINDDGRTGRQMTRRTVRMSKAEFERDFGGTKDTMVDREIGEDN